MPRKKATPKLTYNWDEVPVVLDVPLAARILGFTVDSVSRKCKSGELPAHKIMGEWRFCKDELISYIKGG